MIGLADSAESAEKNFCGICDFCEKKDNLARKKLSVRNKNNLIEI